MAVKISATRFAACRRALGLTQAAAGDALGLCRSQVINLENGRTPIGRMHALALLALAKLPDFMSDKAISRAVAALSARK